MTIPSSVDNYFHYMAGVYNSYYKVTEYKYMDDYVRRSSWGAPSNLQAAMKINFEGKAGSYRKNVTV